MIRRKDGYISATVQASAPRWEALLEAALEQPHPTPALRAALAGLKARPRPNSYFAWLHKNDPAAHKEMARRGGLQNGLRAVG